MEHFQHQRAISQQHRYKRSNYSSIAPKGLTYFSRGKTLGMYENEEVAWVLVFDHLSYRSSIYTHRAHLHPLSSEVVWARVIIHITQLRKLRFRCQMVPGYQ